MDEEQLRALLRDLDALKQRPDPAAIDRVSPPTSRRDWLLLTCVDLVVVLTCGSDLWLFA